MKNAELSRRVGKLTTIDPIVSLKFSQWLEFIDRVGSAQSFESLSDDDKKLIIQSEHNLLMRQTS